MIRSITGTISAVHKDGVTITVHGIGYFVSVPLHTTMLSEHGTLTLHTHLAVRETALDLYGFTTPHELDVFELLLLVPKIGPKSALQILNQASPALLLEAIGRKDPAYLHKLSGIGKKTCENLVQFLHEKIEGLALETPMQTGGLTSTQTDAIDALVSLGYDLTSARELIKTMNEDGVTVNQLITQALKQMS